jgi:hypothetical protein
MSKIPPLKNLSILGFMSIMKSAMSKKRNKSTRAKVLKQRKLKTGSVVNQNPSKKEVEPYCEKATQIQTWINDRVESGDFKLEYDRNEKLRELFEEKIKQCVIQSFSIKETDLFEIKGWGDEEDAISVLALVQDGKAIELIGAKELADVMRILKECGFKVKLEDFKEVKVGEDVTVTCLVTENRENFDYLYEYFTEDLAWLEWL